jgi:hypothetical protein
MPPPPPEGGQSVGLAGTASAESTYTALFAPSWPSAPYAPPASSPPDVTPGPNPIPIRKANEHRARAMHAHSSGGRGGGSSWGANREPRPHPILHRLQPCPSVPRLSNVLPQLRRQPPSGARGLGRGGRQRRHAALGRLQRAHDADTARPVGRGRQQHGGEHVQRLAGGARVAADAAALAGCVSGRTTCARESQPRRRGGQLASGGRRPCARASVARRGVWPGRAGGGAGRSGGAGAERGGPAPSRPRAGREGCRRDSRRHAQRSPPSCLRWAWPWHHSPGSLQRAAGPQRRHPPSGAAARRPSSGCKGSCWRRPARCATAGWRKFS